MRLSLMLDAINNIQTYMKGIEDYDGFVRNKIIVHAVVYNLQCVGESVYKLTKDYREQHHEIDWGSIESFRHIIVHDYYQLEMPLVWSVLVNDLTPLKEYLTKQGVSTMGLL